MSRRYDYPTQRAETPAHDDRLGVRLRPPSNTCINKAVVTDGDEQIELDCGDTYTCTEGSAACTPNPTGVKFWDGEDWADDVGVGSVGVLEEDITGSASQDVYRPRAQKYYWWALKVIGELCDCELDWTLTWNSELGFGIQPGTIGVTIGTPDYFAEGAYLVIPWRPAINEEESHDYGVLDIDVDVICNEVVIASYSTTLTITLEGDGS